MAHLFVTSALALRGALAADISEDAARQAFEKACGSCHETAAATTQRLTRREWQAVTEDMVARGAEISSEDKRDLLVWLCRHFGKVRINVLDARGLEEQMELTGAEASAVVAWRDKKGPFRDFESLKNIPGVEISKLQSYRESLVF